MSLFIRQLYSSLFRARINSTRFSKEVVRLSWPSALNRIGWCRWIVNMSLIPLIRSSRPDFLAINLMNDSRCGQTRRRDGVKLAAWRIKGLVCKHIGEEGWQCSSAEPESNTWKTWLIKAECDKVQRKRLMKHVIKMSLKLRMKTQKHQICVEWWGNRHLPHVHTWNKLYRLNNLKLSQNLVKIFAKFRWKSSLKWKRIPVYYTYKTKKNKLNVINVLLMLINKCFHKPYTKPKNSTFRC